MDYKLNDNTRVSLTKDALEMAVKNRIYSHPNIIHHSDRGLQYCYSDYPEFAQKRGMIEVAQKIIGQAIEIYNKEQRHKSLNMKTPAQAHKENNNQHKFYKKIKSQKTKPNFQPNFFYFF